MRNLILNAYVKKYTKFVIEWVVEREKLIKRENLNDNFSLNPVFGKISFYENKW